MGLGFVVVVGLMDVVVVIIGRTVFVAVVDTDGTDINGARVVVVPSVPARPLARMFSVLEKVFLILELCTDAGLLASNLGMAGPISPFSENSKDGRLLTAESSVISVLLLSCIKSVLSLAPTGAELLPGMGPSEADEPGLDPAPPDEEYLTETTLIEWLTVLLKCFPPPFDMKGVDAGTGVTFTSLVPFSMTSAGLVSPIGSA